MRRGRASGEYALVVGRGPNPGDVLPALLQLKAAGHRVRILFLDAPTDVLLRRYSSSRRRHPLADDTESLTEAIESERHLFEPVKADADVVVDTGDLNVHQLRDRLMGIFGGEAPAPGMQTTITSFGFKHGLPLDADMVIDCRFLPNPYWDENLRPLSGLDVEVRTFVMQQTRRSSSWATSTRCSRSCCRPTCGRGRATCRWPSAAPEVSTARSSSPKKWVDACDNTAISSWSRTATSTSRVVPLPT